MGVPPPSLSVSCSFAIHSADRSVEGISIALTIRSVEGISIALTIRSVDPTGNGGRCPPYKVTDLTTKVLYLLKISHEFRIIELNCRRFVGGWKR